MGDESLGGLSPEPIGHCDVNGIGQWRLEGTICVTSEGGEDEDHFNPLRVPSPGAKDGQGSSQGGGYAAFQRPTNEIFATVSNFFRLNNAPKKLHGHIFTLTTCLAEETCPVVELSMFFSYLKALLCKLFAGIVDTETPEEENPLASLLEESVVKDILSAARVSLRDYNLHARKAASAFPRPGFLKRKASSPGPGCRRKLSCYTPRHRGDKYNLGAAFAGASIPPSISAPKRRPDSRIDRSASVSAMSLGHSLRSHHRQSSDRDREREREGSSSTPPPLDISPRHATFSCLRRRVSGQGSTPAFSPSINHSSHSLVPQTDETVTQYFDSIIETICILLVIKYEHQIMELSIEGEGCGVRRSAEWLAARMLDEMYHDGIDANQALCTQMVLVAEGLAVEEGEYVWRHCSSVDQEVMYVVWGDPPEDVLDGKLQIKSACESGDVWYEWGAFAQPGIRTPDGRLFTSPRLNPLQYRYRLCSPEVAEALNLTDTKAAPLRAPSFLNRRPGRHVATASGERFEGITLSAPPEGSAHKGGTMPRPHIRPHSLQAQIALEEKYFLRYAPDQYCDNDLYEWSFEEAVKRQRYEADNSAQYENMSPRSSHKCCCIVS